MHACMSVHIFDAVMNVYEFYMLVMENHCQLFSFLFRIFLTMAEELNENGLID